MAGGLQVDGWETSGLRASIFVIFKFIRFGELSQFSPMFFESIAARQSFFCSENLLLLWSGVLSIFSDVGASRLFWVSYSSKEVASAEDA